MKFISIIVAFGVIFALGHFLDTSDIPVIDEQEQDSVINDPKIDLPVFSFTTLENKKVSISDYKGKVIILNFWASWCGPCEEEFPAMSTIIKENPESVLIAISSDDNRADVDKFLKRIKKKFPLLSSPQIIFAHDKSKDISAELFNVLRLPETFIINKDLKIVKKVIGSSAWLNGDMKKFIKTL